MEIFSVNKVFLNETSLSIPKAVPAQLFVSSDVGLLRRLKNEFPSLPLALLWKGSYVPDPDQLVVMEIEALIADPNLFRADEIAELEERGISLIPVGSFESTAN